VFVNQQVRSNSLVSEKTGLLLGDESSRDGFLNRAGVVGHSSDESLVLFPAEFERLRKNVPVNVVAIGKGTLS